jgi:AraC-like DNA-binding protein
MSHVEMKIDPKKLHESRIKMAEATVAISAVNSILSYLEAHFFQKRDEKLAFLDAIKIKEEDLASLEQRLPVSHYHLVWLKAIELTGDEAIGLHVGMYHNPNCMSLVSNLFVHSSNLEQGIEQYIEYAKLLNTGMQIDIGSDGENTKLKFSYLNKSYFSLQEIERTISLILQRAKHYINRDLKMNYVHFEGDKPEYHEMYEGLFQCPIRYHSPVTEISFSSSYLKHTSDQKNPYVHSALRMQAENMKQKLLSSRITEKVTLLISKHLSTGDFSIDTISEKLHMNRQTLYRKLKIENQNFKALVDNIRQTKALELLTDESVCLNDISYFLGFSEPSAFSRAFKRWTGDTPKHYQRKWLLQS